MPINLSQFQGTVDKLNNHHLIRFRNSYQRLKYYLNNIDIAFGVLSFSYSILTTISILFLLLSFGSFVCNINKIFVGKIKGGFVSVFVFTFFLEGYFEAKIFTLSQTQDVITLPSVTGT